MLNPAVSFVRVISMLLILLAHFFSWKNINTFQIATVGVAAFLFISGYLYGVKSINNRMEWFIRRVIRVMIPFWILSLVLSIYLFFHEYDKNVAIFSFLETFFNLQGIHFIVHIPFKLGNYHVAGLSHCWFLTVIMLCYLLVAVIKNTKVEQFVNTHVNFVLVVMCLLHFLLSCFEISIGVFVIFFMGYLFQRIIPCQKQISEKVLFISVSLSILSFVLRVLLKKYIDGTEVYDYFISSVSANVCAISFFIVVCKICQMKFEFAKNVVQSRAWGEADKMTYPIYLSHFMFLHEPFEILFSQNLLLQILTFVFMTVASAFLLNKISEIVKNTIILRR